MNTKLDAPKKLVADIQKEIASEQPLGDAELERNTQRAQDLLRWLNEERERRAAARVGGTPLGTGTTAARQPLEMGVGKLPKRDAIVLALEKLGVASQPARVSALAQELFGIKVSTSQFASFRKADERSFRRNPRNRTYLLPALSAVDLSGIAGTVTLSSWPLERRLIGGYSQRVDALQALREAHAAYRKNKDTAEAAVIRIIGREFPAVAKHAPDYDAMAKVAAAELKSLEPRDADERHAAAERAARLDRLSQLFGRPPLLVVAAS